MVVKMSKRQLLRTFTTPGEMDDTEEGPAGIQLLTLGGTQ